MKFFVIAVCILLMAWILLSFGIFIFVFRRRRERADTFESLFSQKQIALAPKGRLREAYERISALSADKLSLLSRDGIALCGRIYPTEAGVPVRGVVMLFHGYRSCGKRNFCLQMDILHRAGYVLFVADQRSHKDSKGKYIAFGLLERYDVVDWAKELSARYPSLPISLLGLSMGGATVLMASSLIDPGSNIRCILADCPFSSPYGIISRVVGCRYHLPSRLIMPLIRLWARIFVHVDIRSTSSAECAARSPVPIMLIHGDADTFVPISHSYEIARAAQSASLEVFPSAPHSGASLCDEARYSSLMLSFFEAHSIS